MQNAAKTKKQLIVEMEILHQENTELRQLVQTGDTSVVRRRLAEERIRAEAMSMRCTDDLYELTATFFREVQGLGINTWYLSLAFIEQGEITKYCNAVANWASMGLELKQDHQDGLKLVNDDVLIYASHGKRQHTFKSDKIRAFQTQQVSSARNDTDIAAKRRQVLRRWTGSERDVERAAESLCQPEVIYQVPFSHGVVSFSDPKKSTRTMGMLAESFSLGYRRYLDLTAAEERAALSAREASYERVRSAILSFRNKEDILAAATQMRRELGELGVRVNGTGINIIDEESGEWRQFAGREVNFRLDDPDVAEVVAHQRRGETYMRTGPIWPESALSREKEIRQAVRVIVDVPFTYGTLAMNSDQMDEFSQEEIAILQGFADPISLAYTRYLDFERLEEQNREIQENTRNKSEFLRRMSHDLRSPMNAIIGYSRLLLRRTADRLDEREQRNLANIETSAGNLLNLINDILDLSRIEAGRIEVEAQPVDLRQLADECADALESIVKEGVELRRELEETNEIQTDPDRVRQVVMNLLGNATKFTDSGSITLSLRSVDGGVELSVADTGVGIPPEDLPHIFDEFRQVERQGGEQMEGTGLGLSIAKRTVVLLGGTVTAESEVGKGTKFTLRLADYEAK